MNLIKGNLFQDQRGTVRFVNDFHFEGVKRFYTITQPDTKTIRAWQGHKLETKYFYAANGAFTISWVKIDNWVQPSMDLEIYHKVLKDSESEILIVEPGHATAIQALIPGSILVVFSDKTLEESKADDYRWELRFFENFSLTQSNTE